MTTEQDGAQARAAAAAPGPRILYIDQEDDLPLLLDRVEEAGSPAIVVLPDGARAVRGAVSARLLRRRAEGAGIPVVAVTSDRTIIAVLKGVGIDSAANVGEARRLLPGGGPPAPEAPPVVAEADDDLARIDWDEALAAGPAGKPVAPAPPPHGNKVRPPAAARPPALADTLVTPPDAGADPSDEPPTLSVPSTARGRVSAATGQSGRSRGPLRRLAIGAAIGIALAGAIVLAWVLFFPAATVTIDYRVAAFARSYQARLGSNRGNIPLYATHLTLTEARTVPATGISEVPDGTATGSVALANPVNGPVIVPVGTILVTRSGLRFQTTEEVRVPGATHAFAGTTNGQAVANVRALQAGPAGNVPSGSIVQAEGRLRGVLLITNYAATSGGSVRTVYTLTASDLASPAAALRGALEAQARLTLEARYHRSPIRFITAVRADAPVVGRFRQEGKLFARVSLRVTVELAYTHSGDIDAFAGTQLAAELKGRNQQALPGSVRQRLRFRRTPDGGVVTVALQARTVPVIDVGDLRARLVGRSLDEARGLLSGGRGYGWTANVVTSPDWAGRLPQIAQLITIRTRQVGG